MKKYIFTSLCFIPLVSSTEPTSPMGNVEAVCRYISTGLRSYGERFLTYKLPETCRQFIGVGESALLAFNKSDLGCYKDIAGPLCTLQFIEYESNKSCIDSLSLFFSLLNSCQQSSFLSIKHSSCTSYHKSSNTILDPDAFCSSSHLRTDKIRGNEESPTSFEIRGFSRGEINDCRRLAESFNACQLVAVNVLGYSKNFCVDGGFSAYCNKYPAVVRDPTFRSICRNIVIPYLMGTSIEEDEHRQFVGCTNIVSNYLRTLQTRADTLGKKSAAATASFYSIQAAASITRDVEVLHTQLATVMDQLDRQSTEAVNALKTASNEQMTLHKELNDMWKTLEEATTAAEKEMSLARYPELTDDHDENLDLLSTAATAVSPLAQQLQKCTDTLNELTKKLAQPGYLAKGQAYGFVPIDAPAAAKVQDRLKRITVALKKFNEFLHEEINKNAEPEDPSLEENFRNSDITCGVSAAAEYAALHEIYKRQIAVVNSAHKFGVQAQTLMTAAASRIS